MLHDDSNDLNRRIRGSVVPVPGDLSLADLVVICWRWKWLVLVVTALWIGGAALWLSRTTPQYSATMVIGPTRLDEALYNLSNASNTLSGSAGALFGDSGIVSDYDYLIELLRSHTVSTRLLSKYGDGVMMPLFGPHYRDIAAAAEAADGTLDRAKKALKRFLNMVPVQVPGALEIASYLRRELEVDQIGNKPMHRVTFTHEDRQFAKWFLEAVYAETSEVLDQSRKTAIETQIDYLSKRLNTVQNMEYRQALISILTLQEQKKILLDAGLPFAAQVVDIAFVGHYPSYPKPHLVLFFAGVAGVLTGMGGALLISRIRADRRTQGPAVLPEGEMDAKG